MNGAGGQEIVIGPRYRREKPMFFMVLGDYIRQKQALDLGNIVF